VHLSVSLMCFISETTRRVSMKFGILLEVYTESCLGNLILVPL
jgi:hypothetical protein